MMGEYTKFYIAIGLCSCFIIGFFVGVIVDQYSEHKLFEDYDLMTCIHNNAESNNYNRNPIAIKKIQDECICFRQANYTNIFDSCSYINGTIQFKGGMEDE